MRITLLLPFALFLLLATPLSAVGAQAGERILEYDVVISIEEDGDLVVTETIVYDFGASQRRGILRNIPVRLHYDDRYDRLYRLDVLDITTSEGAPDQYRVEDLDGGRRQIRIGDPDRTITGEHTYEIRYRIAGALNGFPEHDELYWNTIGADWAAPIDRVSVTVTAPAEITRVACIAGPSGSTLPCANGASRGATATFSHTNLAPYQGMTVVVGFPAGIVPAPEPILEERWSLQRAFSITPFTVGASLALLAVAAGVVGRLLWLGGRDRRWAGSAVNIAFGSTEGETERVGWFENNLYPLEYVPPNSLKPGEIGVLVDEIAHPVDATATIVDLAVRGYLRIEEVEGESGGWFQSVKTDWKLVRLRHRDEDLEEYERLLHDGLFEDGDEVLLSSLKTKFVERLQRVQEALYDRVVEHGWFPRSPKATRERWLLIGFAVLIVGVAVEAAAIAWTHVALMPLALPIAGIALIASHAAMPHRTARGTAALVRVRGFRRFIETAETERARFAENANLFYDYLPYAVVFGATDQWAEAFAGLDQAPSHPDWYRSSQPFAVAAFAGSMNSFTVNSTGTIASTPGGSGSSGFSGGSMGGGGGGGGGGSW